MMHARASGTGDVKLRVAPYPTSLPYRNATMGIPDRYRYRMIITTRSRQKTGFLQAGGSQHLMHPHQSLDPGQLSP